MDARQAWYEECQRINSLTRKADGQCQACGAFRLDGRPPTMHLRGCPRYVRDLSPVIYTRS